MRIQIICRGSAQDGLGHLFRTRTFAREAQRNHDVEVIAIVPDGLESMMNDLQCKVHVVRDDEKVLECMEKKDRDILLFDMLGMKRHVFERLKQGPHLLASLSPSSSTWPI